MSCLPFPHSRSTCITLFPPSPAPAVLYASTRLEHRAQLLLFFFFFHEETHGQLPCVFFSVILSPHTPTRLPPIFVLFAVDRDLHNFRSGAPKHTPGKRQPPLTWPLRVRPTDPHLPNPASTTRPPPPARPVPRGVPGQGGEPGHPRPRGRQPLAGRGRPLATTSAPWGPQAAPKHARSHRTTHADRHSA